MNREIKFRGKVLDREIGTIDMWVYGNLVQCTDLNDKPFVQIDNGSMNEHRVFEVDPSTIGQYTGLKDKNGKEIYEGDLLTIDDPEDPSTFEVVYKAPSFEKLYTTYKDTVGPVNRLFDVDYFKIIGTIHDK